MAACFASALVLLSCAQVVLALKFAPLVSSCLDRHADHLNECLVSAVTRLQPAMAQGIPEMKIPSLEPLRFRSINFTQEEGPVTVKAGYKDVAVYGVSKFDLQYLDLNVENGSVHIGMTVPSFTIQGKYKIEGRIFELPIFGDGNFRSIMRGTAMQGIGYVRPQNGSVHMYHMDLNFSIADAKTKLDNLFPGNQILSDTVHHFLNNNQELLLDEIRPGVSKQLGLYFTRVMNLMFSHLPANFASLSKNTNGRDKHRKRTLEAIERMRIASPSNA